MNKYLRFFFLMGVLASFSLAVMPKTMDLIRRVDDLNDFKTDFTAKVSITEQRVELGLKSYEVIYYRRDKDDSFLILMTGPEVERGNGYLKTGDNFWMYRRNTRTFQHVNRDESIAGTDASADDFEKRKLAELYQPAMDAKGQEIISEEKLGEIAAYKFKLTNRVPDVKYPVVWYWVRKDNGLVLKEQAYSLSGTLMETSYFLKYTQVDGRYVPIKQMYVDEFEKGNKSLVEITSISTQKVEDAIFTKAYLENLSK